MRIIFTITFAGFCLLSLFAIAQVKIGENSAPDSSAILEVKSTKTGFLPPRIALTAKNAAAPVASPAEGLMVYNTATVGTYPNNVTPGLYYWTGTFWQILFSGPQLVYSASSAIADIIVPAAAATVYYSIPGFSYTAPETGIYHLESSILVSSFLPANTRTNIALDLIVTRSGTAVSVKLKSQLNTISNYAFTQRTFIGNQTITLQAGDVLTAVFAVYAPNSPAIADGTKMFTVGDAGGSRTLFDVTRFY